jgi:hypothetical protein
MVACLSASYGTIEVVRGRLGEDRAEELVRFWTGAGALDEEAARARLPEVVSVLIGPDGKIAGANSVYAANLSLISGRQFWVYRSFVRSPSPIADPSLAAVAFQELETEFKPADPGPIGVCYPIEDRASMDRNPGAQWLFPVSIYAGYLSDGRQARIRYFAGARVEAPREPFDFPLTLDHSYRVLPFAEQDEVGTDAVVDLWTREDAMPADEARRRVDEVVAVATRDGELAGIATAYLQHNAQLRMDMWYFRAFVAEKHRASRVAWSLALVTRDRLAQRFVGGVDTRGQGLVYEVENAGLKEHMDFAHWAITDVTFIGENERGDHVRVHYFPGALAPPPA